MTSILQRKTKLVIETPHTERVWGSRKDDTKLLAPGERPKFRRVKVDREILAEVKPFGLILRLKGTRKTHTIAWSAIWDHAQKITTERYRAERHANRLLRNANARVAKARKKANRG